MADNPITERIKAILEESGNTQTYLAHKLGLQRQALNRLLKKKDISRSKYFPELAKNLGVSEDYLLFGETRRALLVTNDQLRALVENHFQLDSALKAHCQDFFIRHKEDSFYFAKILDIPINPFIQKDSLMIFTAQVPASKTAGKIYIVFSPMINSFIIGEYATDAKNDSAVFLKNENGIYLIQSNDLFIGLAIQTMIYFKE